MPNRTEERNDEGDHHNEQDEKGAKTHLLGGTGSVSETALPPVLLPTAWGAVEDGELGVVVRWSGVMAPHYEELRDRGLVLPNGATRIVPRVSGVATRGTAGRGFNRAQ